jgi:hypothetical protein
MPREQDFNRIVKVDLDWSAYSCKCTTWKVGRNQTKRWADLSGFQQRLCPHTPETILGYFLAPCVISNGWATLPINLRAKKVAYCRSPTLSGKESSF